MREVANGQSAVCDLRTRARVPMCGGRGWVGVGVGGWIGVGVGTPSVSPSINTSGNVHDFVLGLIRPLP